MDLTRWRTFSLAFQLVSIQVDLSRTLRRLERDNFESAQRCLKTAMEYISLTLEMGPDWLPEDIRESLEKFVKRAGSEPASIDVAAVKQLQIMLEPYEIVVARERGLA